MMVRQSVCGKGGGGCWGWGANDVLLLLADVVDVAILKCCCCDSH
jgi:hypothetical protein